MVIISTNAMDASIHAVSPELIFEVSMRSGFVGAGGAAGAGAAAGATGAAAGADGAAFSWAIAEAFRLAATSMASTTNSFLTMILPLERCAHLVKLVRPDNGGYQFHEGPPLRLEAGPAKTARYLPTMRFGSR